MNYLPPLSFKVTPKPSARRAFTLVEMLVVLAVLAVLVVLLFPALSSAIESSRRSKCLGNLKQIGAAVFAFAADNNGELPSKSSPIWTSQIWPYACPGKEAPKTMPSNKLPPEFIGTIFCCPSAAKDDPRVRDYAFNYRIGDGDVDTRDRIVTLSRASQHALVADATASSSLNVSNLKARHGEKCNVLYADGHAQTTEVTEDIKRNYNGVFWGRQSQAFRW
jgi:prepilin-type N-terminal cleavage/methylation domain-containing protein/prepilin-type processing-associated H-X9-DG protein